MSDTTTAARRPAVTGADRERVRAWAERANRLAAAAYRRGDLLAARRLQATAFRHFDLLAR